MNIYIYLSTFLIINYSLENNPFIKYEVSMLKIKASNANEDISLSNYPVTGELNEDYEVKGANIITGNDSGEKSGARLFLEEKLSVDLEGGDLTAEERNIYKEIFQLKCNRDVFEFIFVSLTEIFYHLKIYYCELISLENLYRKCYNYGNLMRRIRGCGRVMRKYRGFSRGIRDGLNQLNNQELKLVSCVNLINKGSWRLNVHMSLENEFLSKECTEQQLFDESANLMLYDFYSKVYDKSLIKLKEKMGCNLPICPCLKSPKKKCLLSTIEKMEQVIDSLRKSVSEKVLFLISCKKYLIDKNGSIGNQDMRTNDEQTPLNIQNMLREKITSF